MQMRLHLLGGCNCPDWKPWSSALLRPCILLLVSVVSKAALWNVPVRQQSRTWQVRRSRGASVSISSGGAWCRVSIDWKYSSAAVPPGVMTDMPFQLDAPGIYKVTQS